MPWEKSHDFFGATFVFRRIFFALLKFATCTFGMGQRNRLMPRHELFKLSFQFCNACPERLNFGRV